MILLSRLGGTPFALNPDLVERADCTPDTVITLVDGTKYVVAESLPELIELVLGFRASVVAAAQRMNDTDEFAADALEAPRPTVVPIHRREP